ncbi:hypothetical protein BJF78_00880 [Pseudonocardia sp. CNS-139]|nr:hypothetical protein BJF78_00880 [Pseudonocardia sp. CNS-139]
MPCAVGPDPVLDLQDAPGVTQGDPRRGASGPQHVDVAVDEPGNDAHAEIEGLGPRRKVLADLGRRAEGDDPAVGDADRGHAGRHRIHRVDVADDQEGGHSLIFPQVMGRTTGS